MTYREDLQHPKWPIFSGWIRYEYTVLEDDYFAREGESQPGDRARDSIHWMRWMYREEPRWSDLFLRIAEAWAYALFCETRSSFTGRYERHPKPLLWGVRYEGRRHWCPGWFEHWTFDIGRSDEEVLLSFSDYVDAVERENAGRTIDDPGYIVLMGAEDRWRWSGTKDGSPDYRTDPPCRCIHCRAQGVVRIGH